MAGWWSWVALAAAGAGTAVLLYELWLDAQPPPWKGGKRRRRR